MKIVWKGFKSLVILGIVIVVASGCSKKEEGLQASGSGSLSGRVTDVSGNGLSGVSVETSPTISAQTTDATGNYLFSNVTTQTYTVTAKKSGFVKASSSAIVEDGKTTTANMSLTSGPSYAGTIQPLFNANCTSAGCHAASGSAGNYNVTTYTGTTAKNVVAFDADGSLLYKRISGASAGAQMPTGSPALSVSDQQKIKDWLNSGIPNN